MRLTLSCLAFFALAIGCAAEPGVLPPGQSSDSSETDTFSTDDTESISDTTQQETETSGSDTGADSTTDPSTNTEPQTDDTATMTDSSTGSSTNTQPQTDDSATFSDSASMTDSSTATGSDSSSYSDSSSGDTDSLELPSPCELMKERVDGLVCCPEILPKDCSLDSWSFSTSASSVGCCTRQLDRRLYCVKTALVEETCKHTCGPLKNSLGCLENSCDTPYPITQYPAALADSFGNYKNTFEPIDNSCGDGGGSEDVWFLVVVPSQAKVTAQETTIANVTLRVVKDCSAKTCLGYAQEPETMTFANSSDKPGEFWLVLSEASGAWIPTFNLEFSSQPL